MSFRSPTIKLSDHQTEYGLRKLQILRVGKFYNEKYGNFEITHKMLSDMVTNFKSNVRGVLPALDYAHNSDGIAAGWIKNLEVLNDGTELWADVEMTVNGKKSLDEKEYAYLSAEFDQDYVSNEIPVKRYGAVLLGAALTNRPVIKQMQSAIQLSEGENMDIKELEEKLELANKKLADKDELEKKLMEGFGADSMEKVMEMIASMKSKEQELSEVEEEKKELSGKLELSEKKLVEVETENKNLKKEAEFNIMLSEGKVCVAQKEAFLKGDMVEFAKNAAVLNLSEKGHGGSPKDDGKDPEDKIMEIAYEMKDKNKSLSLSEAISKARKENPELVKKLQEKK